MEHDIDSHHDRHSQSRARSDLIMSSRYGRVVNRTMQ